MTSNNFTMSSVSPLSPPSHKNTPKPLPQGWKWVKLGELIAEAQTGFACGQRDSQGVIQLRMNNVDTWGNISFIEFIRVPADSDTINQYRLLPNDVMFNNTNSTELVGKSALFNSYEEVVVFSNHFTRLRTNIHTLTPELLAAWLNNKWQEGVFARICNRWIGQSGIKSDKLLSLDFPLPPLPEQKRITAILKDQMAGIDKARKAANERLEAVKALPAAFLRKAFPKPGQPLPEGWKWVKLGEVTTVINGSTPSTDTQLYWNGDIHWITPVDLGKLNSPEIRGSERKITPDGLISCNLTIVQPGAVVMSSRAPIGHLGIATVDLCTNQGCKSFVPGLGIDTYFLYYVLKKSVPKLKELGRGAIFSEISKLQCEDFNIPFPPITEQKNISAILKEQMVASDKARKAAEDELKTINALPAAILRKAFNGEI